MIISFQKKLQKSVYSEIREFLYGEISVLGAVHMEVSRPG